jgi:hypothetical protein
VCVSVKNSILLNRVSVKNSILLNPAHVSADKQFEFAKTVLINKGDL